MNKYLRKRPGTSLVEVIMATMLVSVVMIAALDSVGSAVKSVTFSSDIVDGRLLAHSLIAEIAAMPYADPDDTAAVRFGIESDEATTPSTRAEFDDVDDYLNWTSTPEARDGSPVEGASGWTRSVTIKKLRRDNPQEVLSDAAHDEGIRSITVTVADPHGRTYQLSTIRSMDGALQQLPGIELEIVSGVSIRLEVEDKQATGATNVLNHATGS